MKTQTTAEKDAPIKSPEKNARQNSPKNNEWHSHSLNHIIETAIKENWNRMALSDIGGDDLQFRDVAILIEKLHILFESAGLKKGDRVALCGRNSSNWCGIFLACLTGGYVAVPLLHEFKPETVQHLVRHSEAKLLFVDEAIYKQLDPEEMPDLIGAIYIYELGMPLSRSEELTNARNRINEYFGRKHPYKFTPENVHYYHDTPDELAVINYTSGSTGMSKGVMLPFRSIWSNVRFCLDNIDFMHAGEGMVNMLPLAHLYGMVIEMLFPFCHGCHCNFLLKVPSPKILLKAFADIRPKLIITVPLVLEKIIKTRVFPLVQKPMMRFLLRVPFVDDKLLAKIHDSLIQAFGGNLKMLIIGGAALNKEVDAFMARIGFPYTVGYGMTECGPLLTYAPPQETKTGSVGRLMDRMEAKIDSPDPEHIPGNLFVRGDNVMLGYFKNEDATKEVMGKDGWMNTGDMCTIDRDGFITISGRSKTMILGPSGQNIYPEEIEQKLNNLPFVSESLVVERDGKLVALIYPDMDAAKLEGYDRAAIEKIMDANIIALNKEVEAYSRLSGYELMDTEFEKTPKRSIKRFLYK